MTLPRLSALALATIDAETASLQMLARVALDRQRFEEWARGADEMPLTADETAERIGA